MKRLTYLLSGLVGTVPTNGVLRSVVVSCLLLVVSCLKAQPPIKWQKCLGGSGSDHAFSVTKTTDGSYVVAGATTSPNDGDVTSCYSNGYSDVWVVKLNDNGNIIWQKCLGGNGSDVLTSIEQTTDSGYIACGTTNSNDGDVSGNHGGSDMWVVKLDTNGNIQWQKALGGSADESGADIVQTTDGGYIAGGTTYSYDGNVSGNHGGGDFWVVKLNASGNIQWQKCLGGSDYDQLTALAQTADGSYVVTGYVNSNDGNVSGNHGSADMWVVKLSASGNIQWQKCLGGSTGDGGNSIIQTSNGSGYIIVGGTSSNDGDVGGNHGDDDMWIVKLNANGTLQWQKCLGGLGYDHGMSVVETADSGYAIAGLTASNDGDVSGNHGPNDMWIVKLDTSGNFEWQKCLGGSGSEIAYSIVEVADSSYVLAGRTTSNNGDVSGNHGSYDYWVVKISDAVTDADQRGSNADQCGYLWVYPNPTQGFITVEFNNTRINADGARVEIFDVLGQKFTYRHYERRSSEQEFEKTQRVIIDLSECPTGTYLLRVEKDGVIYGNTVVIKW